MWFKNLIVYRLGAGGTPEAEELEAKLAQQPLRKCGGFEMESRGARRRKIHAWIDSANGWLAIDAAGEPMAEQLIDAPLAALHVELPGGKAGDEAAVEMDAFLRQDFGGTDAP